jgi:hypothetical protein
MFHQGIRNIDIFYPNARDKNAKLKAVGRYRELREKMGGKPPEEW